MRILADVLLKQGDRKRAEEVHKSLASKNPQNADTLNNYGTFLAEIGKLFVKNSLTLVGLSLIMIMNSSLCCVSSSVCYVYNCSCGMISYSLQHEYFYAERIVDDIPCFVHIWKMVQKKTEILVEAVHRELEQEEITELITKAAK